MLIEEVVETEEFIMIVGVWGRLRIEKFIIASCDRVRRVSFVVEPNSVSLCSGAVTPSTVVA
jgi:hypothetical protein